jgi:uncharacterized protein YndB with AHSA1/START domain
MFPASAEDVWASLTEPDRTARWFGPWEADAAPGRTIKVQMVFEDQAPWGKLHIEACDPPQRPAVSMADESGTWRMELLVREANGSTELRLVHHLDTEDQLGEVGPGWKYYLDLLAATRHSSPKPDFDDYLPCHETVLRRIVHSDVTSGRARWAPAT